MGDLHLWIQLLKWPGQTERGPNAPVPPFPGKDDDMSTPQASSRALMRWLWSGYLRLHMGVFQCSNAGVDPVHCSQNARLQFLYLLHACPYA